MLRQHKNLTTVAQLYSDLIAAGLDRTGTILALGGGVVGDTMVFETSVSGMKV